MNKILIFSTAYFPFVGGAEVAVKEITDRLSSPPAGGFQFDMITARMNRKLVKFEKIGNINVYRLGIGMKIDKFLLALFGYLKAVRLYRKNNYVAAWSIMASQSSVASAFFKMGHPNVKLLLTLQEGDEEEYLKRYVFDSDFLYRLFIRPWHLLIFKKADFMTVISNYLKQRAQKNDVKCPVEIVPNGVGIDKFKIQSLKSKVDESKQKLGIGDGEKVIITASRLVEKNAVGDVIDAMQYLPENTKFLVLGSGELEESLESQVKSLKLQNRVLFVGNVPNDRVPEYLAISDVFVRPSLSEGLGNSFLEAMAAGVPVIGTNVGGIPDFLKDGETGLFCEVRNPESIAKKVKIILDDKNLRQKLIANAKKLVAEKYDWGLIAEKIKNIFNRLIIKN